MQARARSGGRSRDALRRSTHMSAVLKLTFALIYPFETRITSAIFTVLSENSLHITKLKKTVMGLDDINFILRTRVNDPVYQFVTEHLRGKAVYGIEIVGKDVLSRLGKVIGDSDPAKAGAGTIRAIYGTDTIHNCIHVSSTLDDALKVTTATDMGTLKLNVDPSLGFKCGNAHLGESCAMEEDEVSYLHCSGRHTAASKVFPEPDRQKHIKISLAEESISISQAFKKTSPYW
ncbi:Nucleoside diphosphate kinase [Eumeta japonica]|uniref:Nucleoside diphosphate kinase n=1 Tax=Eumeta variegata TaxID=151549 RepID=A0A4C1VMV8_EUMVA|nr:Nucleoside diphosphate kinase [Eumeta japonica]